MGLAEKQNHIIGMCECGSELWDGDSERFPEWKDGDPECQHLIKESPNLGLATTGDMLGEIFARCQSNGMINCRREIKQVEK